ncbi:transcriptional regulator family: Fungal Specific TF [Trichoderma aggressivum f. europaeum]|uniref:Transcriptional regulator family: Fungal Specific TF n=1 Tax=Trichoderma aggressivum f. europaeum TaxID=173218 RepID=A0AAE1IGN8_9HYPO|nr:transcriptional regulator family: Fungal Specific TF [Trichoderma aggressivum f. europaeum]
MESQQSLASISCFSCRHSKRRCDKTLPTCQLCIRRGVDCCYPKRRAQKYVVLLEGDETNEDAITGRHDALVNKAADSDPSSDWEQQAPLGTSGPTASAIQSFGTATAIQFIAPILFREAHLEIPRINITIPSHVAALTGEFEQIRDISATFFSQVVIWTPVIFRKNFFNIALNPLSPRRTEGILLSLCMKLYCMPTAKDGPDGRTALYKATKQFYCEVESAGILSICILQSAILIAVYEIGHAIYPAAYLTVGACARYGVALGLDKLLVDLTGENNAGRPWMEVEEMRRVWWGILILDRFLNLGNPLRGLTTRDPEYDDYLPVDDETFLNATAKPQDNLRISAAFNLKMGVFARLAQTTYLVNQALKFLSSLPPPGDPKDTVDIAKDTAQLRRTITALLSVTKSEFDAHDLATCCQTAISYCAILLLQDAHWRRVRISSTEDAYKHLFAESERALENLTRMAFCLRKDAEEGLCLDKEFPVFLMQIVYQGALSTIEMGQGNPNEEIKERVAIFKWLIQHLQSRWRVASIYLSILQSKEALMASVV